MENLKIETHYSKDSSKTLALIMVGLPARGKTFISRKISRYLAWLGVKNRIFNVGNYRRDVLGASQPHNFFDPQNESFLKRRNEVAKVALDDLILWLSHHSDVSNLKSPNVGELVSSLQPVKSRNFPIKSSGTLNQPGSPIGAQFTVGIYDATNSTIDRRAQIHKECTARGISVMFIESVCDDMGLIMSNIREVKLSSPDYVNCNSQDAIDDFQQRIEHYKKTYDTLTKTELNNQIAFVKLVNVYEEVLVNKIRGYLQSRIVYFLMNLNITPRSIYFCRHGESAFNVQGRIGGNSDLSPRGEIFSRKLPGFVQSLLGSDTALTIWTSTLKRTVQTASNFTNWPIVHWKQLDELDSGACDGMTYEEIEEQYPKDFEERDNDKFNYRYHGGESYKDLVHRLEPLILELERHYEPNHSILVIGHQAVLRAMYAYFMNLSQEELPYIKIPLHTIIKLTPKAYVCQEERFPLDIPAVDTHRNKPEYTAPKDQITTSARTLSNPNLAGLFCIIILVTSIATVSIQIPMLILYLPYNLLLLLSPRKPYPIAITIHKIFRRYMRITGGAFGSVIVFIIWIFAPCQFIYTGNHASMKTSEKVLAMANHQIYPDWIYLWLMARHQGKHYDFKIMLMDVLRWIPILGFGMTMMEFIFLTRKWAKDQYRILKHLNACVSDDLPLWLLIFPEGTLNTPNNRVTSEKYAEKMKYTEKPEYVILPKSTGLFYCANMLSPKIKSLYDITVGYSGLKKTDIPYYTYLVENCFFARKHPKTIHIHVREFPIKTLPGLTLASNENAEKESSKDLFNRWVRKRFMEKDELLRGFYNDHKFSEDDVEDNLLIINVIPEMQDWFNVALILLGGYCLIPFYYSLLRLLLSLVI